MTDSLFDQWRALGADSTFARGDTPAQKRTHFERRVRNRKLTEYSAGALVIATFAWVAWLTAQVGEVIITLGWLVGIIGTVVVLANLHHRASNLPHNPETDCRAHLRAQLEHQRRALEAVPRWYLAPLVPGVVLVLIGSVMPIVRDAGWDVALAGLAIPAAFVATIFVGVAWLNRRAARALKREIAALDALA